MTSRANWTRTVIPRRGVATSTATDRDTSSAGIIRSVGAVCATAIVRPAWMTHAALIAVARCSRSITIGIAAMTTNAGVCENCGTAHPMCLYWKMHGYVACCPECTCGRKPQLEPHINDVGDYVCEHGTAMDVHCCNCHSGFLFDINDCECAVGGRERTD